MGFAVQESELSVLAFNLAESKEAEHPTKSYHAGLELADMWSGSPYWLLLRGSGIPLHVNDLHLCILVVQQLGEVGKLPACLPA